MRTALRGFFNFTTRCIRGRESRAETAARRLSASLLVAGALTSVRRAKGRGFDYLAAMCSAATAAPMTRVQGVVFDDLEGVALQRAHLHHLLEVVLEHGQVDEADVEAGEEELAGAGHVDGGGRAAARALCQRRLKSRQRGRRLRAFGGFEDLFGFHVEEAQAHGAVAHDAFHVAASAAAAEALFVVERDDGVAALPDAMGERVATVADADAEGPDADHAVELAVRGGEAGGHAVGVVQHGDRCFDAAACAALR